MESSAEYLLLSVIHGLLSGECSPEIRLVGCSVLASPCQDDKMIKPCRSTCDALRRDCAHAFEAIEMAWPYFLDCDRFFASNEEGCVDPLVGLKGKGLALMFYCSDITISCEKYKAIFFPPPNPGTPPPTLLQPDRSK